MPDPLSKSVRICQSQRSPWYILWSAGRLFVTVLTLRFSRARASWHISLFPVYDERSERTTRCCFTDIEIRGLWCMYFEVLFSAVPGTYDDMLICLIVF